MPSSTSSSEAVQKSSRSSALRFLAPLAVIAFALLVLEIFARVGVERGSKVQRMVNAERREAIALRRGGETRPHELLVVGNSLVGQGLDFDGVKNSLPPNWRAHRFWIYNTTYEDWFFGLRRLFTEGSRPDLIAIVLAAPHWYVTSIRGDYSAQYLFAAADLPGVQSSMGLSNTGASSLFFAHFSKFYALRGEIRKVLLEHLMPDLPRMTALLEPTGAQRTISDEEFVRVTAPRIKACRDLAEGYGAGVVLIVPPMRGSRREDYRGILRAAKQAGAPVLTPMYGNDLPPEDFADELHLTPIGAQLFTGALMRELQAVLSSETRSVKLDPER